MKLKTGKLPSKTDPPQGGPKKGKAFWKQVKAEFLAKNLDPDRTEDWSLKDISLHYGVPYDTVAEHSSKEKWFPTLRSCQERIEAEAEEQMIKRLAITEADIRIRQQQVSAHVITKAMAGIEGLDPSKMSAKDLTNLLRLGLTQEREAVGLAQRIDFNDLSQPLHKDHESPLAKMEEAARKNALADKLLKVLDEDAQEEEPQAAAG